MAGEKVFEMVADCCGYMWMVVEGAVPMSFDWSNLGDMSDWCVW